jgi:DNA-binding NarL/FixJ family response regulator
MVEVRRDGSSRRPPFSPTEGFVMAVAKNSRDRSSKKKATSFPLSPGVVRTSDADVEHQVASLADQPDSAPSRETLPSRVAAHEEDGAVSTIFARQVQMAYGLLRTAIEEAADAAESNKLKVAAELRDLQALAIRSIQASALATIDLFEAAGSGETAGETASKQFELARRRRETINGGLVDFLESARNLVSIMIDPLKRQMSALSGATSAERGPPETSDSILSRLNTLTSRQKGVLELVAQGLPNKVIAHELGISETTVKAHVGEILRKLKVYNRARAIVMLSHIDMRRIRSLPIGDDAESV